MVKKASKTKTISFVETSSNTTNEPTRDLSELFPTLNDSEVREATGKLFARIFQEKDTLDKDLRQVKQDLRRVKREQANAANRNVEVLAIFAALFTFVSAEVQIVKAAIPLLSAVGYTLIILGGLGFFLVFLDRLISDAEKKKSVGGAGLIVLVAGLLIIGIVSVLFGSGQEESQQKDIFYTKSQVNEIVASTTARAVDSFKNCINTQGLYGCLK